VADELLLFGGGLHAIEHRVDEAAWTAPLAVAMARPRRSVMAAAWAAPLAAVTAAAAAVPPSTRAGKKSKSACSNDESVHVNNLLPLTVGAGC
ncbi:MAG TPA: hypothetical protein VFG83_18435, partial [Kofleriaceae bacterium]|nr:hypothetical protein [Kofleriaceae bacterium]